MKENQTILTIVGSAGGVAKSVLSILNKSVKDKQDSIYHIIKNSKIHLIDYKQKKEKYYSSLFPNLKDQIILHEFDLKDTNNFIKHLKNSKTSVVIDVSWADTVEMLQCCDQLGIKYVNTALENTMVDENEELYEGFGLIERMRILEEKKHTFKNITAVIGSGMNPGVVQWMAIELLKNDPSDEAPLACYIVEDDNSFYKDNKKAKKNVIYTTWSPECFLDEAILSYPMFMRHRTPLFLYENVYDIEFKVTLGDKKFYGCLMPHEEVYTLGKLYDMECGFLYKINDHTSELIRSNIEDVDKLWDFEMKVLDPLEATLKGEDLAGVLLVYNDKERYMYNISRNDSIFARYKTNATYFQVACGIYASLSVLLLDKIPKGAYYLDELLLKTKNNYGQYLTYYMTDFVTGENKQSDGLLHERIKKRT
ncbi:S-adenosylmethionine decarboxylase related protein [Psychrobacillus sp. NEAU-3TGS]|uniref:S-adenosylmethionine decarboxylase related protein n=1 Tax=Psychrobacillus sp. NEAU-3TGS TaxID=2995412 RepID=UPI00249769DC|nr:S-adenosylmethionine decarboxylase related protein [Psychrobacillus sp. NEAU-3TGS]MDI2588954.1 S-adenosylmethionine decarboxylase related protein [Psychrobacillus sp. NEAU-3TGS]